VYIAVYGFFSHTVLEEPYGIFLMAFITAAGWQAGAGASHRSWSAHSYSVRA
jgi:hypothetical protein